MGLIPYEDRALMVLFYARFEQDLRRESVLSDLTYGHDRDVAAWQQRRHDRVREGCTTCLLIRAYEFRNGHTYKPVRRFSVYRGEELLMKLNAHVHSSPQPPFVSSRKSLRHRPRPPRGDI